MTYTATPELLARLRAVLQAASQPMEQPVFVDVSVLLDGVAYEFIRLEPDDMAIPVPSPE